MLEAVWLPAASRRKPGAAGQAPGPWPWVCPVTKDLRRDSSGSLDHSARCTCVCVCACVVYTPVWEGLLLCASACLPCDPVVHVYPSSIYPSLHPSSIRPFTIHPSSVIHASTTCPLTHGFDNSPEMLSVPVGWLCHPGLKGSPLRDHPTWGWSLGLLMLPSWTLPDQPAWFVAGPHSA